MADNVIFLNDWQRANAQRVRDHVAFMKAEQCRMRTFVQGMPNPDPEKRGRPECNTAGCLAGWGAVLCAPTSFDRVKQEYGTIEFSMAVIPADWASQHLLPRRAHSVLWVPDNCRVADMADIGEAVLGPKLASLFYCVDWPQESGMTDQDWMLMVLDAALRGENPREVAESKRAEVYVEPYVEDTPEPENVPENYESDDDWPEDDTDDNA